MQALRVIISGGGTGGHIFPAIAIARALKERDPATEILFVGARGRMEMEKVPEAGFPIEGLWISGLQRSLSPRNLLFPFRVIKSILDAQGIIKRFKPDIAIGVGGYASAPLLYAAQLMRIPTLIQEQNSYAGLTNKWLSRRAKKICVAFEGMERYFPAHKIVMTGNPVRSDIASLPGKQQALEFFGMQAGKPVLLVLGGSLGARTINESIHSGLDRIRQAGVQLLWQTGKFYYAQVADKNGEGVVVTDFIKRMDLAYAAADVVISRAGALSIAELCICGKPAVLVPSPNVAEDHQTKNAMSLVKKEAALLVKDTDARLVLVSKAIDLLSNKEAAAALSSNIQTLARPGAAQMIADEIYKLRNSR